MQDEACKSMKTNHVPAQARHEIERTVLNFVQGVIWFGDKPCRKYTENQGIRDRKKVAKNTRNNKVYAQPIQEIEGKLAFFDRSRKPGKTKNGQPRGDLCSGFKFIYDKGFGSQGAFAARKKQKTKTLRKSGQDSTPHIG